MANSSNWDNTWVRHWDDDERSSKFVSVHPSSVNSTHVDCSIGKVLKDIATNNYNNHFNKDIPEYDYEYYDYYCVSCPPFSLYDDQEEYDEYENVLDANGDIDNPLSESNDTNSDSNSGNLNRTLTIPTESDFNSDAKDDHNASEANSKMIDDIMYKKFAYC
jgi:hypothetical protein